MAKNVVLIGAVVGLATGLAGCSSFGTPNGPSLASLSGSPPPAPPPAHTPIVYGAFLDGPVAAKLPEADLSAALDAEDGALTSGERRTWKGSKGVYGFVVPGSNVVASGAGAPGECRSFTHTIYFAGRPQTGKGTGCRSADGSWHVTS